MKKLTSFLLSVLLVFSLALPAFAAQSVVDYRGHGVFSFDPGSEYTVTDLFDNFKGVMPGDTRTETIWVENSATCCDYIKVYMRAQLHDARNPLSPNVSAAGETIESMEDFLAQLSMEVWNGEERIYSASPDELDGLRENVLLGTFRRGEGTTLEVELEVPITLDNTYAFREGEVDWVFTVEEYDDERPDTPKTGDHMDSTPYILMLAAGMIGMFFLFFSKKRKKSN